MLGNIIGFAYLVLVGYGFSALMRPVAAAIEKQMLLAEREQHRRYMNEEIWRGDKG